jgi:predicted secreted protein
MSTGHLLQPGGEAAGRTIRSRPAAGALAALLLALAWSVCGPARAADAGPGNQVDLSVEASREVPNDLVRAVLYAEVSDPDPARVAAQLNRIMNEALAVAKAESRVQTRSGAMTSAAVFAADNSGRISAWRGRSELRLQSHEPGALGELIGRLQATLQVAGISYAVSPALQRQVEDELITEAIGRFQARAEIVRRALAGSRVRIVHMAISAGGNAPIMRPMLLRAAPAAAGVVPAPQIEAGASQVQVSVNGTVEIE